MIIIIIIIIHGAASMLCNALRRTHQQLLPLLGAVEVGVHHHLVVVLVPTERRAKGKRDVPECCVVLGDALSDAVTVLCDV
jgi:hypothetical protein